MKAEATSQPLLKIKLDTASNTAKSEFLPGDIAGGEQRYFKAFLACQIVRRGQFATIEKMDLVDVGNAEHGEWRIDGNVGAGLLECFPPCRLCGGFAVFHETGGQCPEAKAWLNGAPAKQDLAFPFGDTANDQARIFVLDMAAR